MVRRLTPFQRNLRAVFWSGDAMEARRRAYLHAEQSNFHILARLREMAERLPPQNGGPDLVAKIVRLQMKICDKIYCRLLLSEDEDALAYPYAPPARRLSRKMRSETDRAWRRFLHETFWQDTSSPPGGSTDEDSRREAAPESSDTDDGYEASSERSDVDQDME